MTVGVRDIERERHALGTEQDEITRRLKRVHKTSGHLSDDDLEALVADDNNRLLAIRRELAALDRVDDSRPPTADEAVVAVNERLMSLPADWRSLPLAELKGLLKVVVGDLFIDLATQETTMTIRLPSRATSIISAKSDENLGRVSVASAWLSSLDTTPDKVVHIENIACARDRRSKCFSCRRLRAA